MSSTNFPNDDRKKNLLTLQTLSESKFLFLLEYPQGFPGGSDSKESAHHAGHLGSIPGFGRGEGMATHFSILIERIPWIEEPGESRGRTGLNTAERLTLSQICPSVCSAAPLPSRI